MVSTYVGENKEFERQFLTRASSRSSSCRRGHSAERIRAAGAGIGGFFTPTAYGTIVAEGKETRTIDGKPYVLETPLHADFAFVHAWKGDRVRQPRVPAHGPELQPRDGDGSARSPSPRWSTWSTPGEIDPDHVVTPGIFVKHIFEGDRYEKRIERRTVR